MRRNFASVNKHSLEKGCDGESDITRNETSRVPRSGGASAPEILTRAAKTYCNTYCVVSALLEREIQLHVQREIRNKKGHGMGK